MKNKNGVVQWGLIIGAVMFVLIMLFSIDLSARGIREGGQGILDASCDPDLDGDGTSYRSELEVFYTCPCDYDDPSSSSSDAVLFYRVKSNVLATSQWSSLFKSSNPTDLGFEQEEETTSVRISKIDADALVSYLTIINQNNGAPNNEEWAKLVEDKTTEEFRLSANTQAPDARSFCGDTLCTTSKFKRFFFETISPTCRTPELECQARRNNYCEDKTEE